jgi:hypothetical protein
MPGSYLKFVEVPGLTRRKTKIWRVLAKDGDLKLGSVSWMGHWRCDAFWPDMGTVFERLCLQQIAGFCEQQTHRLMTSSPASSAWMDPGEPAAHFLAVPIISDAETLPEGRLLVSDNKEIRSEEPHHPVQEQGAGSGEQDLTQHDHGHAQVHRISDVAI